MPTTDGDLATGAGAGRSKMVGRPSDLAVQTLVAACWRINFAADTLAASSWIRWPSAVIARGCRPLWLATLPLTLASLRRSSTLLRRAGTTRRADSRNFTGRRVEYRSSDSRGGWRGNRRRRRGTSTVTGETRDNPARLGPVSLPRRPQCDVPPTKRSWRCS